MANSYTEIDPGMLEIYGYQKSDILSGKMFGATKSTYEGYKYIGDSSSLNSLSDGVNMSPVDNFLINGYDHTLGTRSHLANGSPTTFQSISIANAGAGLAQNNVSTPIDNFINDEKNRIKIQKETNNPKTQDGFFALGTVYLNIPPSQINVTDEARSFRYSAIRQPGEVVATSGRNTTRIDLDVVFNGIEDINNKLRPLVAQLKTIPFIQMENEYIRAILNPFDLMGKEMTSAEALKKQAEDMKKSDELLNQTLKLYNDKSKLDGDVLESVKEMKNKGYISEDLFQKLTVGSYLTNPNSIPKEEIEDSDIVDGQVDRSKWLRRNITIGAEKDDILLVEQSLSDIGKIEDRVRLINRQSNSNMVDISKQKEAYRSIVGVLSQMSISTVPGFPETLSCRMAFYVFNYDPFSIDFGYISGYNKNAFTTDITKCDLFIDWYTKRWLAPRNDPNKPGLGYYSASPGMTFTYATKISPVGTEFKNDNLILGNYIKKESFQTGDTLHITGISVSMQNTIQFLPVLSCKNPTCQYLGNMNSSVKIMMESTSLESVKSLGKMVEKIRKLPREDNRVHRNSFIHIKNDLLDFMAMPFFSIDDYSVDTVPGSPGLYSINMDLIEYKVGMQGFQKLKREFVTTNEDILAAARWIIIAANKYKVGGQSSYKTYYNEVLDDRAGWFCKDSKIISSFNSIFHGQSRYKEIVKKLESVTYERNRDIDILTGAWDGIKSINALTVGTGTAAVLAGQAWGTSVYNMPFDRFGERFAKSLKNDPNNGSSYWVQNLDLISSIVSVAKRSEIVGVLRDKEGNQELQRDLKIEEREKDDKYCYPDLELPKYRDLPNGAEYINTKAEMGVPRNPSEDNNPAQTDASDVDPDFFLFKGSIWKTVDGKSDNEAWGGVNRAINAYKSLGAKNKAYRRDEPMKEEVLANYLSEREKNYEITRGFDPVTGDKKIDPNIRKKIEGKLLEIVRVHDGDTVTVSDGEEEYSIRLLGIEALEAPGSPKLKGEEADPSWTLARDYILQQAPIGSKVRVYLGSSEYDQYRRMTGNINIEKDGGAVNLNGLMADKSADLKLKPFYSADNPINLELQKRFLKSHETWVEPTSLGGKLLAVVDKGGRIFGATQATNWFKAFVSSFTTKAEDAAANTKENARILMYDAIEKKNQLLPAITSVVKSSVSPEELGSGLLKYLTDPTADAEITKEVDNLLEPTNNLGDSRFDRDSEKSIELLSRKIRESQKDDTLRMSRAFPTFKFYFIEEDMPEWGRLDDEYAYQAITSIDITKSRTEAADTAVVTFINTLGTLDRSVFGLYSSDGIFMGREQQEKYESWAQETEEEQTLEEFILKPGTVIKIKMGYCSDPNLLETVFTGAIAEVSGGDIITVVAQGFGSELMNIPPKKMYKGSGPFMFGLLNKMIKAPEVKHFGKLQWIPDGTQDSTTILARRTKYDPKTGTYHDDSWYRNISGIKQVLSFVNDTTDDNIWIPGYSENLWYRWIQGGDTDFITQGKTIWDIFREMQIRTPGYITTVVPFDNRATIYFGPADFLYRYTSQKQAKARDHIVEMRNALGKTSEEKLTSLVNDKGFSVVGRDEINRSNQKLSDHLTGMYSYGDKATKDRILSLVGDINDTDSSKDKEKSISFCRTIAQSNLMNDPYNEEIASRLDGLSENLAITTPSNMKASLLGERVSIDYIGKDDMLKSPDGKVMNKDEALKFYDSTLTQAFEENNPYKKLIRNYHFKDSFHHILGNSIVATSEYLNNRVVVEYSNEKGTVVDHTAHAMGSYQTVTSQVDDDIWPEKLKTKLVMEKNAKDMFVAWKYAQGHLSEEMRKMYGGHLTLYGDPSIKPYDTILIADYFTDMFGPVEVEQVTHHFSQDTGFVTTIVPNLLCHVNNTLQQGSLTVAGAYMDSIALRNEGIMNNPYLIAADAIGAGVGLGSLPSVRRGYASVCFWISGLIDDDRRESISFSPLYYAGRPFIAGVEGMRRNSLIEAYLGRFTGWTIKNSRIYRGGLNAIEAFQGVVSGNTATTG